MESKVIKERFKSLKKELKAKGKFNTLSVGTRPKLSAKEIAALEKKHKCALPEDLRNYYMATDGHLISWRKQLEGHQLIGQSAVQSLGMGLAGSVTTYLEGELKPRVDLFETVQADNSVARWKDFMIFEQLYLDQFILIDKKSWPEEVNMFVFTPPASLRPLSISFSDYLGQLFDMAGLVNWQETLFMPDEQNKEMSARFNIDLEALNSNSSTLPLPAENAYISELGNLLVLLESSPKIKNVELTKNPLPHPAEFKKAERALGCKLPQDLVDFYSSLNGLRLQWRADLPDEEAFFGLINIPSLAEAFGGDKAEDTLIWDTIATKGKLWYDETPDELPELIESIKDKRVFDQHLSTTQVLMEVKESGLQLFYWVNQYIEPLDISFASLIQFIFATGGLEHYAYFLTQSSEKENYQDEFINKVHTFNPEFAINGTEGLS